MDDVRYALRLFRRAPAFTTVAILTLALGIGANAAIFSVVKAVLVDALPYADAGRLASVQARILDGSADRVLLTAGIVNTIASRQRSFERLAAFDTARDAVLGADDASQIVRISWVEPGLFGTLGVPAGLGRTFQDTDRAAGYVPVSGGEIGPDSARAVLLTDSAWSRLFAHAPDIVGREVRINGIPRTIVGVLPRGFVGPMGAVDFFFAFDLQLAKASGAGWLRLLGRLKQGVTHDAARRDVAAVWASRDDPREFSGVAMSSIPLRDALVGRARAPLLMLLASAALVLVVACANLAGALLSRGLARRKELAVRAALGAGRRRLVRQLLVESTLLAVIGGAAGVIVGAVMLSLMRGLAAPLLPAYATLSLDAPALVVMALLALAAGVACGIVPALSIHPRDPHGMLSSGSRGATDAPRPRRLRGVMVAGQLALCAMLLAGASLLTRSLFRLTTAPLGFEPDGVLAVTVRLLPRDYPTLAARSRFHQQIAEGVRRIPGVDAVAVANKPPAVDPRHDPFTFDGAPPDAPVVHVVFATVSDDYFRVMRVPVLQGRTFDRSDGEASTPTAVIGETLARRYWPDGRAVGARIRLGGDLVTVVGIVGDVRNDLARLDPEPMAYRSFRQSSTGSLAILVATRQDPMSLVRPVQRELSALNASMVIQRAMPLAAAVDDGLVGRKLPMLLMSAFAILALLLATIGVYAMFATMASAREREFGVRVALGSRPRAIAALLLRQGAVWMVAGISAGAVGTALGVQWLRRVFADVPSFDPVALGGALAVLVAAATVALLIPVRRATRADPIAALRAE